MRFMKYGGVYKIAFAGLMLLFASIACDVDQNFPALRVGASPTEFFPAVGEIHRWPADVVPGKKYEVNLLLAADPNYSNLGHSSLDVDGKGCSDCVVSIDTSSNDIELSFFGPANGHVTITFIAGKRYDPSTIQIREFGNATIDAAADALNSLSNHLDIFHFIFYLISGTLVYIAVKQSHILWQTSGQIWANESPQHPKINFVWLAIGGFTIVILISILT